MLLALKEVEMGKRRSREFWAGLVEAFEVSELTQREFAERAGVSRHTFSDWLYRLRDEQGPAPVTETALVRVVAAQPMAAARPLELVADNGATIRFEVGTEPGYIAELAAALGSGPC